MTPFEAYKLLCTVAGLQLLSTVSAQSSVNLIENGSFEKYATCANGNSWCIQKTNSLIAPWTVVGGGEFEIDKIPSWNAPDGSWTMDLSPNNAPATIQQVLTGAVPGTTYTINFKLNANRYCGDATKTGWIQVLGASAGKQTFSYNSATTSAWQTVSYTFIAPTGGSTLQVASTHSSSCGPVIDAFTMFAPITTSTILTTSVLDQTIKTTTTVTENTYTTTRRVVTVYYDDDLHKVVTAPAEISAATATVYTTIYTPVVAYTNKTITETSTKTPAVFWSTIRDTATVVLPTVTFTATV